MGEIVFFPGAVSEDVLREREVQKDMQRGDAIQLLTELEAISEGLRGLIAGHCIKARSFLLAEMEMRHEALRELLGAS